MKKIVRLTESDLVRLVKRVIKEQTTGNEPTGKEHTIYVNSLGFEKTSRLPLIAPQGSTGVDCKIPFIFIGSSLEFTNRNECLKRLSQNTYKINLLKQSGPDLQRANVAGSSTATLARLKFTCDCGEMFETGSVFHKLGIKDNDTVKVVFYRQP